MKRVIGKLLNKLGYINKEKIKIKLLVIMSDIEDEINSRPQYHNRGKKHCLRVLKELYEKEFK